ncbi:MAG: hypothetical protein P9E24_13375 [Candidatus Competibacter sp.]|nr:hypothetical protein [Candidatus Competibacter sp.]MDG4584159.1 hypothetical protein [Candidatus Competibacter sp.]
MNASQVFEPDSSYQPNMELFDLNPHIRSVVLHIRAHHGAMRILGIGRGALSLCHDLRHAGYAVASMEPEESGATGPAGLHPAAPAYPPLIDPHTGPNETAAFEMAISIESSAPFSRPSALVKLAATKLRHGGILVLSMPYGGYLRNLLITAREWWNLPRFAVWDGGHMQRWSRKCLTTLLKSNGFTVVELIGVRNRCSHWEALILVARKIN